MFTVLFCSVVTYVDIWLVFVGENTSWGEIENDFEIFSLGTRLIIFATSPAPNFQPGSIIQPGWYRSLAYKRL